jgi:rhodanese-related sulfurtransferase
VYYVAVGSIPGEGRRPATGTTGSGAEEMAMAREISREQVRLLMDEGAQIVDVLPAREYGEDHLPGAINLPLRRIETEAKQILDPARPVVVYCADSG